MHISEGVLSPPVLALGGVITVAGTAMGLKHLDGEKIMTTALLTSTFFVASLIHVPVGPANVHLILSGLMGITLGWACFPAILTALFLQVLFFQYGGFTVLGVNTANMAVPAIICYLLFRPLLTSGKKGQKVAAFASGFIAVLLGTLFMAGSLFASDQQFFNTAKLVCIAHIPLMFIEGIITMFAVTFLAKVQPEFLQLKTK
ncbi:cobalt transporter CbiM [Desulfotalea psychrophila]|nr:cobalt transporter CbiM [Desulfotalea psychrophila]